MKTLDTRVSRCQGFNDFPRMVPTTVLHEDHLETTGMPIQNRRETTMQLRQAFRSAVNGDHYGEAKSRWL
jgi:hypothetical protein